MLRSERPARHPAAHLEGCEARLVSLLAVARESGGCIVNLPRVLYEVVELDKAFGVCKLAVDCVLASGERSHTRVRVVLRVDLVEVACGQRAAVEPTGAALTMVVDEEV